MDLDADPVDADEKETTTFSCLAISEKRPHQGHGQRRPSGCTGIFYQLFDWNRRLAKTSRKNKLNLISSSQTPKNSTSNRFGAHDNLLIHPPSNSSKFHLIAEENAGGFPNAKKHRMDIVQHKHEMRPPSLVAKLMGLDAIPTPKKLKQTRPSPVKMDDELVDVHKRPDGIVVDELCLLKQRIGQQVDVHDVGRFGHDSLQFKNVLSRSRKHLRSHHPKLPSPVKSPRVRSGKNAARLIDAATRILEPRLRVTSSRANAITYPRFSRNEMAKSSDMSTQSVYDFEVVSPCKNCGIPNGDTGIRQITGEQPSPFQSNVSRYGNESPQKWHWIRMNKEENDEAKSNELERNQTMLVVSENSLTHNELAKEERSFSIHSQKARRCSSTPYVPEVQQTIHSSDAFNPQQWRTNKTPFGRETVSSRPKLSANLQGRRVTFGANGVTENIDISKLNRRKLPKKVDNERFPQEMEESTSKSQTKTPDRKRRIINATGKLEYCPSSSSKPGIIEYHRPRLNSKLGDKGKGNISTEQLSFTFQSPAKYKSEVPLSKNRIGSASSNNRMATSKEKIARPCPIPAQPMPVSSDVLDTLLKLKLEELAFQERRDQGTSRTQSKTSKILQELISALAAENHTSTDLIDTEFSQKRKLHSPNVDPSSNEVLHYHDLSPNTILAEKGKMMTEDPSNFCDSDHLSPGSVLGASFSNSSCVSSSLGDYSEIILQHGLPEYTQCTSPISEPATQLKQMTSTDKGLTVNLFVKRVSVMLEELMQRGAAFSASKLRYVTKVLLHAGLVLENGVLTKTVGRHEFFIRSFFDQLETFANAILSNSRDPPGLKEGNDETQLRGILLDLAVEYLDSRFGNSSVSIFDLQWRLPLKLTQENMILDLNTKIMQWADLAGKTPDEVIEWEVRHTYGYYWDDYEIGAGGVCCDLDEEVLKTLVEEIVTDLLPNQLMQSYSLV